MSVRSYISCRERELLKGEEILRGNLEMGISGGGGCRVENFPRMKERINKKFHAGWWTG